MRSAFETPFFRVAKAEDRAEPRSVALATAVARSLFKLMAYKDEYEVARLHSDPKLRREIAATFDGPVKLKLSLAPPLFARKDPVTGCFRVNRSLVRGFFPLLRVLAKLRPLRGTLFDPFAQTAERKAERALRDQYFGIIAAMELALSTGVEVGMLLPLASAPDKIRGFGHVKARSIDVYKRDIAAIQAGLDSPGNATPEVEPPSPGTFSGQNGDRESEKKPVRQSPECLVVPRVLAALLHVESASKTLSFVNRRPLRCCLY